MVERDRGGVTVASIDPTVAGANAALPRVRAIEPKDLRDALAKGLDDFAAMPTFAIFIAAIYPVVGLILLRFTFGYDMLQLVFPLIAGFPLVGPFVAIGLYEMSRRREQGLAVSWEALKDIHGPCILGIVVLGIALLVVFFAWLGAALLVYRATFGDWVPPTIGAFALRVFTTLPGWSLIIVGCGVGFLCAVVAFAISVVSLPMLLDRDVGPATAVLTSVKAVIASPATMALWGLIVVGALVIGFLPFFFGLAVVLPVLGHSTWHLYRKVVEP